MFKYTVILILFYANITFAANLLSNNIQPIHIPKNDRRVTIFSIITMPEEVKIPLKEGYFHSFYTVDIMVENKGPYRFIFDTGAEFNYISEQLAKELGLKVKYTNKTKAITPVGTYNVDEKLYQAASVKMGDGAVEIEKLPFFGSASIDDRELEFKQNGIVGVIGLSTFNHVLLTLDLANEQIILKKGTLVNEKEGGRIKIINYSPRVPVRLMSDKPYYTDVIPDTGYSGQFNFTFCERKLPVVNKEDQVEVKMLDLYKNAKTSYLTHLKGSISFSGINVKNPIIIYLTQTCNQAQLDKNQIGIMGVKILNKYKVTIDQKNERILFVPNK